VAALVALFLVLAASPSPARAAVDKAAADSVPLVPVPPDTSADSAKAAGTKSANSKSQSKGKKPMTVPETLPTKPAVAPAHIEVQHILIGFVGSVPGKPITRTKEQAKKLAYEILSEAHQGANFDSLVAKYTDDRPPGIYKMAAPGVSHAVGEYPRDQMVPAFGDVGFAISPGNIDIADYDPAKSPYGWHIIKRLR
jgi:hypothetical protein